MVVNVLLVFLQNELTWQISGIIHITQMHLLPPPNKEAFISLMERETFVLAIGQTIVSTFGIQHINSQETLNVKKMTSFMHHKNP